jgi:hypothetical protein
MAEQTRVVRRRGFVTELLIGEPLPQRLRVPKRYQAAVTALFDRPSTKHFEIGRYLRYNLVAEQGWAVGDAKAILDDTYPWEQYGFAVNDEGNQEGPDCLVIDEDWNLLNPRGQPTLDLKERMENWSEDDAFDDLVPKRRNPALEICITVLSHSDKSLLQKLKRTDLGWNLTQSKPSRRRPHVELTHEIYSGRAVVTEPERGMLFCRIEPTGVNDPERLLALVMGALHRWLHDDAHSITVQYVRASPKRKTRRPTQSRPGRNDAERRT